eukprot:7915962-Pyramimonas_sp.AAC.1
MGNSDINPSPKGKSEGWKRKRSKPPTPRGRVGFYTASPACRRKSTAAGKSLAECVWQAEV